MAVFHVKVLHGAWKPLEPAGETLRIENVRPGTTIGELKDLIIDENKRTTYASLLGEVEWFSKGSALMYGGFVLDDDRETLSDHSIGPGACLAFAYWYTLNVPLTKHKLALFRKTFEDYDEDGSGEIDADELFVLMTKLGMKRTKLQCKQMVDEVDDDLSGEIGFEEFCMLMVKVIQEDCEGAVLAMMEDGKDISEQELRARDSGCLIQWEPGPKLTEEDLKPPEWRKKGVAFDPETNSYVFADELQASP
jgi:hypothetical protein